MIDPNNVSHWQHVKNEETRIRFHWHKDKLLATFPVLVGFKYSFSEKIVHHKYFLSVMTFDLWNYLWLYDLHLKGIRLFVVSLLCEEIWLWQLEIALSAGTNEPHNFKRRIPSIFYQYIFFKWNRNGYHYESVAISLTNFEGYHY